LKEYYNSKKYNKTAIPKKELSKYDYNEEIKYRLEIGPRLAASIPQGENQNTYMERFIEEVRREYLN